MLYVENGECHFEEALVHYVQHGFISVLEAFFRDDHSNVSDSSGKTLLHYAAKSNNISMTQHFIDIKYNLDSLDNDGNTPLMLAVQNCSSDTVKLLIKAGANIYLRDLKGRTILDTSNILYSCDYNEFEKRRSEITRNILAKVRLDCWNNEQLLISKLAEIDCTLIKVIHLKDSNVTRLMLENGYSVGERKLDTDETALHEAVQLGDFENVKLLLEYGADIHAQSGEGFTPIHSFDDELSDNVIEKIKILNCLIERGALVNQSLQNTSLEPSHYILKGGKLWAINTLMQYDFNWSPFFSLNALVSNKNSKVLEAVRGKNLDVNSIENSYKRPVLSTAASLGLFANVKFLLENGADPNIVDVNGRTPFTYVFMYSSADLEDNEKEEEKERLLIVRLMLEYGAKAEYFSNKKWRSVFDVAKRYHHEILLEPVIAHLAMTKSSGKLGYYRIPYRIDSCSSFKRQFEQCEQQLEKMKSTVIYDSVTLYKLLTESQWKITRYVRNHEFAQKFKQEMKIQKGTLDAHYSICLQKRVGKATHELKLRKEAVIVMNEIIGCSIKNNYEILCEIVDYLSYNDLKNVYRVSNFDESKSFNLDTLFGV